MFDSIIYIQGNTDYQSYESESYYTYIYMYLQYFIYLATTSNLFFVCWNTNNTGDFA